jgi:intracellular multiplication protein IcmL
MSPEELPRLQADAAPRMARVIVAQSVAIVILIVLLGLSMAWGQFKKPLVIAATATGQIIPIVPLDKPYTSDARVVGFADECMREAFSHDFVNFRTSMTRASECFTTSGNESFFKAMEPIVQDLEQRRMVMSITVNRPPAIVKTFRRGGNVFSWEVQAVVTLNREGTRERMSPANYVVRMTVERVPLEDSPRGISVAQINVSPGSGDSKI